MIRTTPEIIELLKLAHSLGIQYLKLSHLEVHFEKKDPSVPAPVVFTAPFTAPVSHSTVPDAVPSLSAEELVKPMSVLDQMSEEEILYYATPHYDELQAKKKAHEEELKERVNG